MTCESVKTVFVCSVIASASLGNSVFLNLCKLFFYLCVCTCENFSNVEHVCISAFSALNSQRNGVHLSITLP